MSKRFQPISAAILFNTILWCTISCASEKMPMDMLELKIKEKVIAVEDIPQKELTIKPVIELNYLYTEAFVRTDNRKKKYKYRDQAIKYLNMISEIESEPGRANTLNYTLDPRSQKNKAPAPKPKPAQPVRRMKNTGSDFGQAWARMISRRRGVATKPKEVVRTFSADYDDIMRLYKVTPVDFCIKTGDIFKKRAETITKSVEKYIRTHTNEVVDAEVAMKEVKVTYGYAVDRYMLAFDLEKGLNEKLDLARSVILKSYEKCDRNEELIAFLQELIEVYPSDKKLEEYLKTAEGKKKTGTPSD